MTIQTIFVTAGAIIAVVVLLTFTLPSAVHVERSALISAPPATIFELITSNSSYQKFNPYKDTDPDLKIELYGPSSGVGSGFNFHGKEGKGSQTISKVSPNELVTMQIDLGSMGKPVQQIRLVPSANGTEVVWGMDADLGNNPLARVFGLFMDRMMGPIFERGLSNLSKLATQS